ncbi:S-adenosyl-L-methionine-dependent methyltransferase [Obelidium mucronatum]|nr:S-adenosyl-L-methionine-dependent methyltransferase [Obelidium mucronatum]
MIWQQLWNSGVVLRFETVIELGSGRGLGGLAAASLFPGARVTLTDASDESLAIATDAIALNGLSNCSTSVLNWYSYNESDSYDLVIGADVLYLGRAVRAIVSLLTRLMKRETGRAILVDPDRCFAQDFEDECAEKGLAVERVIRKRGDLNEELLGTCDANVQCKQFNVFFVTWMK